MHTFETITDLQTLLQQWRVQGQRIALVTTMGNLHAGHLALIDTARQHADKVVTSIYVNPLQFGPNEDFTTYPRTLETDIAQLKQHPCDALFLPSDNEIYPRGKKAHSQIYVPQLGEILCGADRPGFFQGIATIVTKLFGIVKPDVAIFGEKDFQQLMLIKRLVRDFYFPIEIIGAPIQREIDGLAMSSRNQYLSAAERQIAPQLYQQLCELRGAILSGSGAIAPLLIQSKIKLEQLGFRITYLTVRKISDLCQMVDNAEQASDNSILLAAGYLGKTRLIDNIKL